MKNLTTEMNPIQIQRNKMIEQQLRIKKRKKVHFLLQIPTIVVFVVGALVTLFGRIIGYNILGIGLCLLGASLFYCVIILMVYSTTTYNMEKEYKKMDVELKEISLQMVGKINFNPQQQSIVKEVVEKTHYTRCAYCGYDTANQFKKCSHCGAVL